MVVATALVAASQLLVPEPPQRLALPQAGEMVELVPYLDPAELELPSSAGLPETVRIPGDPFTAGRAMSWSEPGQRTGTSGNPVGPGRETPRSPGWRLSAIMIAGERRVAILNDRLVRPGDRLEDGTRVTAVEPDHIVLITSGGERRRLDLER